ncbi:MAG: hypothetical protein WAL27_15565 [Cellulosimicrobium cellulans]
MPPSRHGRRCALPRDHSARRAGTPPSKRRAAPRPQARSPRPAWLPGASAFAAAVVLAAGIPAAHAGLIAAGTVAAAQPVTEAGPAIAAQARAPIAKIPPDATSTSKSSANGATVNPRAWLQS